MSLYRLFTASGATTAKPEAAHIVRTSIAIVNPNIDRIVSLMDAAISARDWLCETPEGTDQYERGYALRVALHDFMHPAPADKGGIAHIVRCVNSHAALVGALSESTDELAAVLARIEIAGPEWAVHRTTVSDRIRLNCAALAAARKS